MNEQYLVHSIDPVFDENSKILILGSFPSVKSRNIGFFYGNSKNRFWKVISRIFECEVPDTIEGKKEMILKNHIALWDVIYSCRICGSSDSSIKDVVANDMKIIFDKADIKSIITNGKKSNELYERYLEKELNIKAVCLPSTSPANAQWSEDRLYECWKKAIIEN